MNSKFTPTNPRRLSEIEFCQWLGEAYPGERLEYHVGFLALDLTLEPGRLPQPDRKRLKHLAERAMWSFDAGLVHLVQVRLGPEQFSYIAIARPKRQMKRQVVGAVAVPREAA